MVRLPIFKVGQKVIGIGNENAGVAGTVIGTSVSKPAWQVIVSICNDDGSLSFAEGREHMWEVVA